MYIYADNPLFTIIADPTDSYPQMGVMHLTEACGLLIPWACDVSMIDNNKPLWQTLEDFYQFPMPDWEGSVIGEDKMMRYPGDPDLAPVALITRRRASGQDMMLIYPYAIVAIKDISDEDWRVTRMD
jgi:hypothetical protein